VTIPDSGHYYVVFFNDSGAEPRAVKVTVRAARGAQKNLAAAQEQLQKFERRLNRIFIFETFSISVKECGEAKAFTGPTGIVLCKEYVQKLYETLKKNKAKASDAALFTVLHEVGHVFLKQWDYPFFDNEEIADEFATAIMVMFGQKERVRAKAEFFSANPSLLDALACECTVLASYTEPVKEVIEHQKNGLLADFFNDEGLASLALRVLKEPQAVHVLASSRDSTGCHCLIETVRHHAGGCPSSVG